MLVQESTAQREFSVATIITVALSLEKRGTNECLNTGRRKNVERASAILDMSAEKIWLRKGLGIRDDLLNSTSFKN